MKHPGRAERELTIALVDALPARMSPLLSCAGMDLTATAEHLLYTALRHPSSARRSGMGLARAMARIARASAPSDGIAATADHPVVVLVTQPVHATLFEPVGEVLDERDVPWLLIDAETRQGRAIPGVGSRLVDFAPRRHLPELVRHAMAVAARAGTAPDAWLRLADASTAVELFAILRRGLGLAALDGARVRTMARRLSPRVIACFSESGTLARIAPAAAHLHDVPVVDLPHAEAADPWGTAGAGYDAMAVYGPRSVEVVRTAGIDSSRVFQVGPLRYDRLLARGPSEPSSDMRRVVFASQPTDAAREGLHPDVIGAAFDAAVAAATALAPAEVNVVPHPTEPADAARRLLARAAPADGVQMELASSGLHEALDGAWLLVTASSQSVYDAVVCGVPAITVHPGPGAPPVTFAAEGISIGVTTQEEAAALASALGEPDARADAAERALTALGDRIGPLDGRSAERAAQWLIGLSRPSSLESSQS